MYSSLINKAQALAHKHDLTDDVAIGHAGCAIKTKSGKVYTGVSVNTSCNLGFCAEVCAMAEMIKDEETEIEIVVAVGRHGELIPPCGRCRELMYQINRKNLHAKILIDKNETTTLEEFLPHRWQDYWGETRT